MKRRSFISGIAAFAAASQLPLSASPVYGPSPLADPLIEICRLILLVTSPEWQQKNASIVWEAYQKDLEKALEMPHHVRMDVECNALDLTIDRPEVQHLKISKAEVRVWTHIRQWRDLPNIPVPMEKFRRDAKEYLRKLTS
jgi:hypothetical protein